MKKWNILIFFTVFFTMHVSFIEAAHLDYKPYPISFSIKVLPWEKVDSIIPRKSTFTIIDVETGLFFNVQRRAGSKHADVQPLTHEDTKIMKKIYGGQWSWNRRAILVLTNDQLLAASMHGMPHGAGALKNGFPGHFCVHFYGSTTHRSKYEDFAHKLMILRAGGKLEEFLTTIQPVQTIQAFEIAVNQKDQKLLNQIVWNGKNKKYLFKQLNDIEMIHFDTRALSLKKDKVKNQFVVHINVNASIYKRNHNRTEKEIHFILWKDSVSGQWVIDDCLKMG